jgi:hypothetical protein
MLGPEIKPRPLIYAFEQSSTIVFGELVSTRANEYAASTYD